MQLGKSQIINLGLKVRGRSEQVHFVEGRFHKTSSNKASKEQTMYCCQSTWIPLWALVSLSRPRFWGPSCGSLPQILKPESSPESSMWTKPRLKVLTAWTCAGNPKPTRFPEAQSPPRSPTPHPASPALQPGPTGLGAHGSVSSPPEPGAPGQARGRKHTRIHDRPPGLGKGTGRPSQTRH
jgi:hypothetical protein